MERDRDAFFASMSHELRTPLTAIIGLAEVLNDTARPVDDETRRRFVGDILEAAQHLNRLLDDVVDICNAESGRRPPAPQPFEIDPAVRGVAAVAKALASRHFQKLDVRVEPGSGLVQHDPPRFKQALYALIANAVQRTPPGGSILVSARRLDGGWLEVAVAGAPSARSAPDGQRAAEPAPVGDAGAGSELDLVRDVIRQMGGDVRVEPAGGGVTFAFRVPPFSPEGGSVEGP